MVMTDRARSAVQQRNQSGNTRMASYLTAVLYAIRHHPMDGVGWQTGEEPPSTWLLKVSGGTTQDISPGIVATLTDEQSAQQLRKQVGSGRSDRAFATGPSRQEILSEGKDCRRHNQLRVIVRHQCHPGLRPVCCVKIGGMRASERLLFKSTF
ncbi:hypothetical protein DR74_2969 [Enterobacter cloacae]|nr:hypothetical protein DR74_2969 [Enterobacter cloacae]